MEIYKCQEEPVNGNASEMGTLETYLMLGGEGWSPRVGDISLEVIRMRNTQSQPYKEQEKRVISNHALQGQRPSKQDRHWCVWGAEDRMQKATGHRMRNPALAYAV